MALSRLIPRTLHVGLYSLHHHSLLLPISHNQFPCFCSHSADIIALGGASCTMCTVTSRSSPTTAPFLTSYSCDPRLAFNPYQTTLHGTLGASSLLNEGDFGGTIMFGKQLLRLAGYQRQVVGLGPREQTVHMWSLLYHWLLYAPYLYPSIAVIGIYRPPTSSHRCLALPPKPHRLPISLSVHGGRQDQANH